jgi:hypothetical protein
MELKAQLPGVEYGQLVAERQASSLSLSEGRASCHGGEEAKPAAASCKKSDTR